MEALLAGLQASGLAGTMRNSVFLYPLANVLHVLGALCFFAAVAAMDVRVLGHAPAAGTRAFISRLRPAAFAGLAVQLVTGIMLLAPEATHIGHNPAFRIKLAAILLGLLNVALLEILLRRSEIPSRAGPGGPRPRLRWLSGSQRRPPAGSSPISRRSCYLDLPPRPSHENGSKGRYPWTSSPPSRALRRRCRSSMSIPT